MLPRGLLPIRWAGAALVAAGLTAVGATAATADPPATAASAPQVAVPGGVLGVQVGGRQLLRDCKPWVPRGLSLFGRLIPRDWRSDPGTVAARDAFGPATIDLARAIGADVLRLQIGMPFLDPQSPQHRPAYLGELRDAVALARRAGFSVILSMQWQGRTAVKPVETAPAASALRAWRAVGPAFAGDLGVAFELFNEPTGALPPTAKDWSAWQSGHQALIDALRSVGARNLLIVNGLHGAQWLDGAPALTDPIAQLAYAVHPYFGTQAPGPVGAKRSAGQLARVWDRRFGQFAERHPVIVTEWGHAAKHCVSGEANQVQSLLDYLAERRIGVIAYGVDEQQNRLLTGMSGGRPVWSSFRNRSCDADGAGPGEMLQGLFERQAREAARAQAVAPAACERPTATAR
ncbi:MAG: glycoside hydrolase family 5 protein [Pseudomonadota bacterium]